MEENGPGPIVIAAAAISGALVVGILWLIALIV